MNEERQSETIQEIGGAIASGQSHVLVGYGFNEEDGPYFIVDDIGPTKTVRIRVPILGRQVRFFPSAPRCIGIYDILTRESSPCPRKAFINPNSKFINCASCYKQIGFDPAFFRKNPEAISKQQKEYNAKAHYVYLAYFGPKTIKVGTAYCDRLIERLTEQGARTGLIVGKYANADEACKLEQNICTHSRIPDKMYAKRKITLLGQKFVFESAKEELFACFESMRQNLLACNVHTIYGDGEIVNLNHYYFLGEESEIPRFTEMTNLETEIQCTVKALVGKVLIVQYNGMHKAISVDKLVGKSDVEVKI